MSPKSRNSDKSLMGPQKIVVELIIFLLDKKKTHHLLTAGYIPVHEVTHTRSSGRKNPKREALLGSISPILGVRTLGLQEAHTLVQGDPIRR